VGLHEVDKRAGAARRTELVAQTAEELRVLNLGAATVAENRADERRGREGVVDRPRRLGRARFLEEGGDAVGVGREVVGDLPPFAPVRVYELCLLGSDEGLGLCGRDERAPTSDQSERVDTGDVVDRRARRPATERQQQPTI